jgi:hypothetical protein
MSHFFFKNGSGAGSIPPFEKGLHRKILHAPKRIPAVTPQLLIHRFVYSEQVGEYIQVWRERWF